MLTSLILSLSIKSSATVTFSIFICLKLGLLLNLPHLFWLKTSNRAISLRPSAKSVSSEPMRLFTHFKCSLHHLVKVFFWIFFHVASAASSLSVAGMSSSLSCSCWMKSSILARVVYIHRSTRLTAHKIEILGFSAFFFFLSFFEQLAISFVSCCRLTICAIENTTKVSHEFRFIALNSPKEAIYV